MLPMKTGLPARALRIVPYLTPDEVQRLCAGCRGRHRDRDALLILVLFQTGLRISEALSLTVGHLSRQPCRQYFYLDSEHHLIDNGIVTSARDTFNAYTAHTLPVKCNESLREDYCRWFTTRERNCEGNVWAQRYGMAHLFHSLKDLYQGEIVITGEAGPETLRPVLPVRLLQRHARGL